MKKLARTAARTAMTVASVEAATVATQICRAASSEGTAWVGSSASTDNWLNLPGAEPLGRGTFRARNLPGAGQSLAGPPSATVVGPHYQIHFGVGLLSNLRRRGAVGPREERHEAMSEKAQLKTHTL